MSLRSSAAAHLYFYDAISPIVLAESIDMSKVFRASRWARSLRGHSTLSVPGDTQPGQSPGAGCRVRGRRRRRGLSELPDGPRIEYAEFHDAVMAAEKAALHEFDDAKFFEGCLPIEVMAGRGVDTLRFGPMKPVGLTDPRTGREPYACVQLRQDNLAGDHFSLVGFQTQMKWGEQARVLRLIPGLENAEFVRFGMIHRNTYINGPDRPARDVAGEDPRRSVLRRADLRRGRLRRVGRVGPDGRAQRGRARARSADARAAADDRARRARLLRLARRSAALSADQHHVRDHARRSTIARCRACGRPTAEG